jgi:FtsP/CotA-like multicopper oxidase with cupredoxin domain
MGAFVRRRRGPITVASAIAVFVLVFIFISLHSTRPALTTSGGGDPYTVPVAVDTNSDPDIFETTITAEEHTAVDVNNPAGIPATVLTYNGTIPGPEFRLHVGETVIVHFENHIAHPTAIHWHGIELNNESDGTPLTQNQVPPNGKFTYKFRVTRPGMYWYHPHHHSSTNQVFKGLYGTIIVTDADEQLLVSSGVLPPASQTRTLALSDITVCGTTNAGVELDLCQTHPLDEDGNTRGPYSTGDVPNIQKGGTQGTVHEGDNTLTNGKNVGGRAGGPDDNPLGALGPGAQTLDVVAGQGYRFRIGSEATIRFFRLRLTGSDGTNTVQVPIIRVGGQGGLLDKAIKEGGTDASGLKWDYDEGEILLDPGDRVDVVVVFPPTATGVFTLWTKDFPRTGQGNANIPTVPVAHFNIVGSVGTGYHMNAGENVLNAIGKSVEVLGAPTGGLLSPAGKPNTNNPNITLTNTGSSLGINDVLGKHDFPGVDYKDIPRPVDPMTMASSARWAKVGDILELTVTNITQAHHPFHLHGFSIQPISLTRTNGPHPVTYNFPYHEFRDNIDIPGGKQDSDENDGFTLKFRVRLDDRPQMDGMTIGGALGRWVFHCHIFFHASFGMISEFDVVDASGNERPYIDTNAALVTVNEGQTATATGTFKDPDGDPVTLSASIGTVMDTGSGTWSWSYTTKDGPAETQVVAITATDSHGHTSQAGVSLVVNNVPPTVTITSPIANQLFQLADLIPVTATFTDPGTLDTHTCSINWGDTTSSAGTVAELNGSGNCTGSHTYATGGHKTITVTVTDKDGGQGSKSVLIDVNSPPDCSTVIVTPDTLWATDHSLQTVTLSGATDPDGDPVTYSITSVTQDEPVSGGGDGNTAPDAQVVPGHPEQIMLRSERSGNGNGRVYRITFTVSDGRGGTCSRTIFVTVPHDQNSPAVDSLLVFNSM